MNKRSFLKGAGAALLGASAIRTSTQASIDHVGGDFTSPIGTLYSGGVVSNASLAGPLNDLILNVYLAVTPDGTDVGTVSDPVHTDINSHLAITTGKRQGDRFQIEGTISSSKTPELVGQGFTVVGVVQADFTSLALTLPVGSFIGQGFMVNSSKFTDPTANFEVRRGAG